jgi:hypothetical protein
MSLPGENELYVQRNESRERMVHLGFRAWCAVMKSEVLGRGGKKLEPNMPGR